MYRNTNPNNIMKKHFPTSFLMLFLGMMTTLTIFSQAPESLIYQAEARDYKGDILKQETIEVRIAIRENATDGIELWSQTYEVTTDKYGFFTLILGDPEAGSSEFSSAGIDWANNAYYLNVQVTDRKTNTVDMGTTQLLSVPYALHAKTAEDVAGTITESQNLNDVLTEGNDAGGLQIKNMADPTDARDAATKAYVDELENKVSEMLEILIEAGLFVKDYDGNTYNVVRIGNQLWMAENLRTTTYNDGTPIQLEENAENWSGLTEEAYCWYDNDPANYADVYGAIYNWYTVETGKLCPAGWHVPTDAEWKELEIFLGMSPEDIDLEDWRGTNEGSKLAGIGALWPDGDLKSNDQFGKSGFLALPGGYRDLNGSFTGIGESGWWWSSSDAVLYTGDYSFFRELHYYTPEVFRAYMEMNGGLSVRCVHD